MTDLSNPIGCHFTTYQKGHTFVRNLNRIWCMLFPVIAMCSPSLAREPAVLKVLANEQLRTIDTRFFGGGTEFFNRYFELAMKHPNSRSLIANTVGFLRFPHGTSGQHYFWDQPNASYNPRRNPLFLTPEFILDACRDLNLEPVFQVNTYQFRKTPTGSFEESKELVAPGNRKKAAKYAAAWVRHCRQNNFNITWWEIGNEDWIYWNGHQYGAIANAYAKAMKQADPSIRILLQGKTDTWNGGFQRSYGPVWMKQLVENVDRDLFDAISVHLYVNGEIPDVDNRPLPDELATIFARIDLAR